MKQIMIDMMAMMMPFMKLPIFWIGLPALVIGGLLLLLKLGLLPFKPTLGHQKHMGPVLGLQAATAFGLPVVSWVLIALGIFYLGCQAMGLYLGMTPMINFGDPTKFEFDTRAFWIIGAFFLVPGLIFGFFKGK